MKLMRILTVLTFIMCSGAFAAETSTDCLMMREQNERNNPKAGLTSVKPKPKSKSGATQQ